MIEETILNYLNGAGITAKAEVPEGGVTPPCCIVERTGGRVEEHLRRATVAVQSYGDSLYDAAYLNGTVVAAMLGITALPQVSSCTLNSDYNFTDTTKRLHRYQAVFDLVYYE